MSLRRFMSFIISYPGHEELELALIRAYEATGEEKLLNLAIYFIEERGVKRPEGHYFDVEAAASGQPPRVGPGRGPPYSYHQADRPIREMESIEGHAVRAMFVKFCSFCIGILINIHKSFFTCF